MTARAAALGLDWPAGSDERGILFDDGKDDTSWEAAPDCLADLNLDQMIEALTAGREDYDLAPVFGRPLTSAAAVRDRQAVLADLDDGVRVAVAEFAALMRGMRANLTLARQVRHPLQKARLFVSAAADYCEAVGALAAGLTPARSAGLVTVRQQLDRLRSSADFAGLRDETAGILRALSRIHYAVHISGSRVTVSADGEEPDYREAVTATFRKFWQADAQPVPVQAPFPELLDADDVEAGILERVALLYPAAFADLTELFRRRPAFPDPAVSRFDREIQFYLAYLDYIAPLRAAGLEFCYPQIADQPAATTATGTFDLVLAARLAAAGQSVVSNDVRLDQSDRLMVITGPNQGGKTTYARGLGQLHYLAGLGLLVPGSAASIRLPGGILTLFERAEEVETSRGRLLDDLTILHEFVQQAAGGMLIILNEPVTAATLADARAIGSRLLSRLAASGALCICVTFVDELASLPGAVSMVADVSQADPPSRTFRLVRRPADGHAYADAVAARYGLGYAQVSARIRR